MGKLPRDPGMIVMQVFTPRRAQTVTQDAAWTPGSDDRVFAATQECTYRINGSADEIPLAQGQPRGIVAGANYTFNYSGLIEVM